MKLSDQLRAMSHNPYSYPSPRLNEVMQQAADQLDMYEVSYQVKRTSGTLVVDSEINEKDHPTA